MLRFWRRSKTSNQEKQMSKRDRIVREFKRAGLDEGVRIRSSCRAEGGAGGAGGKRESYPWLLATDKPVRVFDWKTYEIWPEVLLVDGLINVPDDLVLLDSHRRSSVKDILGSVRDVTVRDYKDGKALFGNLYFDKGLDGQAARDKVERGHLVNGSLGYDHADDEESVIYVTDGMTVNVNGTPFVGPVKVVTRWWYQEFSALPLGADVLAKVQIILRG
jgi:hypothetical protein